MILSFFLSSILVVGVSPELTLQNKDYWLGQLKNPSAQLRINALQKLAELKYLDTISSIAQNLSDPEPSVRFAAIRSLSEIPSPDSLSSLENALNSESDPYLKSEIRRGKKSLEDLLKQETNGGEKEATKTNTQPR